MFLKKYQKVSLENRTLSKKDFLLVQEGEFRNLLAENKLLVDEKSDTDKLNSYYSVVTMLRLKIKKSFFVFRFGVQLLEHLRVLKQEKEEKEKEEKQEEKEENEGVEKKEEGKLV